MTNLHLCHCQESPSPDPDYLRVKVLAARLDPDLICLSRAGPEYGTTEAAWKGALSEADRRADLHIRYQYRFPCFPNKK